MAKGNTRSSSLCGAGSWWVSVAGRWSGDRSHVGARRLGLLLRCPGHHPATLTPSPRRWFTVVGEGEVFLVQLTAGQAVVQAGEQATRDVA
jgi:hypothetical protein